VSIYPTEIVKICSLDIGLIASKYDLSSVQSLKYTGTHIMPFHKHRLAELMPNLRQLANVNITFHLIYI